MNLMSGGFDHILVGFPGLPGNMDFRSNLELNQSYKVRTWHPALHGAIYLHPKTGLARHPVKGMSRRF